MPAPNTQNWRNMPPAVRRPVMAQPTTPLPAGLSAGEHGYTREVQGNELASTHMEALGKADNRVLQQARQRGVAAGASRGGMNSNLAAAGGEAAWLDAAGNVAMQQAGAYGTAAGQNLDSVRQQRIASEGNATQIASSEIGAAASRYNSDNSLLSSREGRDLERSLTESGREWTSGESARDRDFRSGESQRDRDFTTGRDAQQQEYTRSNMGEGYRLQQEGADNDLNRQIAAETFRNMLDNPEEWDEYELSGAVEFFSRFMNPRNRQTLPAPTTPVAPAPAPVPAGP